MTQPWRTCLRGSDSQFFAFGSCQRPRCSTATWTLHACMQRGETILIHPCLFRNLLRAYRPDPQTPRIHADPNQTTNAACAGAVVTLFTNSTRDFPITFEVMEMGFWGRYRPYIACGLLFLVYAGIFSDVIHRALCTIIGSVVSLVVLALFSQAPTMKVALSWMSETTLALLFGMTVMLNFLADTGVLEYAAVSTARLSNGVPFRSKKDAAPRHLSFPLLLSSLLSLLFFLIDPPPRVCNALFPMSPRLTSRKLESCQASAVSVAGHGHRLDCAAQPCRRGLDSASHHIRLFDPLSRPYPLCHHGDHHDYGWLYNDNHHQPSQHHHRQRHRR